VKSYYFNITIYIEKNGGMMLGLRVICTNFNENKRAREDFYEEEEEVEYKKPRCLHTIRW
jgi:hypothetical protein